MFFTMLLCTFLSEMGDKTQLFIIAMTSKYKLRDIIFGTVGAVLLLNAIAVAAGSALSGFLGSSNIGQAVIKFAAAAAFFIFSYTSFFCGSGGEHDAEKPRKNLRLAGALTVGVLFFAAEFGDKSQLLALGFSSSYGASEALKIFAACSLGLILADALAFAVSYVLGKKLPEKLLIFLAGIAFAAFGAVSLYEAFEKLLGYDKMRMLIYSGAALLLFITLCLVTVTVRLCIAGKKDRSNK